MKIIKYISMVQMKAEAFVEEESLIDINYSLIKLTGSVRNFV